MSNLFIIGNGFDRAHGLPTSYQDFYHYLLDEYPYAAEVEPTFSIEGITMPDGSIQFNKDEVVALLIDVISVAEKKDQEESEDQEEVRWQTLEKSLGRLNFDNYFEDVDILFSHEDDDSAEWRRAYRFEDISSNFHLVTIKIKELFSEWINTVDISKIDGKDSLYKLFDPERDSFLNFNYTFVLEEIYGAINVEHIHGSQGEKVIIGHGEPSGNFENHYTGSEWALAELHDNLRKDTQKAIKRAHSFFDNLAYTKKIYSYGFSFSEVDLPYIEEICKRLNTKNITWYLSDFNTEKERETYKEKIKKCGFKGNFKIFSV
ncbi:bacteriophage abortive infection AbiH family protein [Priestia megaterium]|uniref:bacteriophage abortive infection AbiH family protein n=1 Tax=Priestia megaterium TaxID=1404 RepID=UPI002E251D52|nr:bacteriophage abortive infection AbiH family protein [Priestia megaterium]